jgi:Ca2+-binding EF-hand superfamily protein
LATVVTLGFTLLGDAADELLRNAGLERHQEEEVGFFAFMGFIETCRRTHGFTEMETRELMEVYNRFDYDHSGELDRIQVLDLLHHRGQISKVDEAKSMSKWSGFDNNNGTMNPVEYLRLMRLQREALVQNAQRVFDCGRGRKDTLPTSTLVEALSALGVKIQDEVLEELLIEPDGTCLASLKFDTFVRLVDRAQEMAAAEARRRAGFLPSAFHTLSRIFETCDQAKQGSISLAELIGLFSQAHMPLHTLDHREALLRQLDAARLAAVEAGVQAHEVGQTGKTMSDNVVRFWDFLHLVRIIVQEHEEASSAREKDVVEQTKFTPAEVSQFRQIFYGMLTELREEERVTKEDAMPVNGSRANLGEELSELLRGSASLPPCSITFVLSSIGLRASVQQREDLQVKLHELTQDRHEIDFACFLQLMRWMLDTDYANISGQSPKGKGFEKLKHLDPMLHRKPPSPMRGG